MPAPDGLPVPGLLSGLWGLKESIVFLNHGSFGVCPLAVQRYREKLLRHIEEDPMEFLLELHQPLLRDLTSALEGFTRAQPGSIVVVENATTGINTVLRNLPAVPGDLVMVTDQEYFSSQNALTVLAGEKGLGTVKVDIPWPVTEDSMLEAFEQAVRPGVRYAVVDHIISASGIVLPLKKLITLLWSHGIETIVDGAHGPGQVSLDLRELGCLAYTGNCHKWLCSPRSAALLYVRPDFQKNFRPLVVSHLPGEFDTDLSDYSLYFSWNGTPDPTPALSVPAALDFMGSVLPGGIEQVMCENRKLVLEARRHICSVLGVEPPCPESMVSSMAAVPLPGAAFTAGRNPYRIDPLQKYLRDEWSAVVPVTTIRNGTVRLLRLSAKLYNSMEQYEYLARALKAFPAH